MKKKLNSRDSITINVTRKDLLKGIQKSLCFCPIALAVRRKFPNHRVTVDGQFIRVQGVEFVTPDTQSRFIEDFDSLEYAVSDIGFDLVGKKTLQLCIRKNIKPFKFTARRYPHE